MTDTDVLQCESYSPEKGKVNEAALGTKSVIIGEDVDEIVIPVMANPIVDMDSLQGDSYAPDKGKANEAALGTAIATIDEEEAEVMELEMEDDVTPPVITEPIDMDSLQGDSYAPDKGKANEAALGTAIATIDEEEMDVEEEDSVPDVSTTPSPMTTASAFETSYADFSPLPAPSTSTSYNSWCVGFFDTPDGSHVYGACPALPENKCPAVWGAGCKALPLTALDATVSYADATVMW